MRDHLGRNWIRHRIDEVRRAWSSLPPDLLPPGLDLESAFKYILDRVPTPEVSYRVDALVWCLGVKGYQYPFLPDYSPHPSGIRIRLLGDGILWLRGLGVEGPTKKATWKVVYCAADVWYVLDRFGLERDRANEILSAISRTPDGKILRYPSAEAAKEAVAEALLKIGLLDPIIDVDKQHLATGYDS
jgi:hypothetical protein